MTLFKLCHKTVIQLNCMLKVLQSRGVLMPNKLIGSFKLDVATAWSQQGNTLSAPQTKLFSI